jgi:hypothetical protein
MRKILSLFVLLFVGLTAPAQLIISGTITDTSGLPVPFATVAQGAHSVSADADGRFSIRTSGPGDTITFSAASFKAKQLVVRQAAMQVQLEQGGALQEVVINGYEIRRKRMVCGICTSYFRDERMAPARHNEAAPSVRLYPNPARNSFTLDAQEPVREGFISDMNGKRLQHFEGSNKAAPVFIQLGSYPTGTYLVRYFVSSKGWVTEKLVLMH